MSGSSSLPHAVVSSAAAASNNLLISSSLVDQPRLPEDTCLPGYLHGGLKRSARSEQVSHTGSPPEHDDELSGRRVTDAFEDVANAIDGIVIDHA